MGGSSVSQRGARSSRRALAALAAVVLVPLLGACGGGGGGSGSEPDPPTGPGGPSTAAPVANATVDMRTRAGDGSYTSDESYFAPAQVRLRRGGTVTWSNDTGLSHNVTFNAVPGAPADVPSSANGSAARTFASVGTFDYQCTNHGGMAGSVVVVE